MSEHKSNWSMTKEKSIYHFDNWKTDQRWDCVLGIGRFLGDWSTELEQVISSAHPVTWRTRSESGNPNKFIDKEEYEAYVFGDGSDFEETTNGRASKTKAQQKNPTKAKPRAKGSKDSKTVRDSSGQSPRAVKEKSSGVRKPKLPNVSKPKKSVQGTNDSGKKTLPGSGRTKRQTQQRTTK